MTLSMLTRQAVLRTMFCCTLFTLSLSSGILQAQPVIDAEGDMGIGTLAPDPSALMDLTSTGKGLLIPRLTTAESNAIPSPAEGLMIYNTDVGTFQIWSDASGSFRWDALLTTGRSMGWLTVGNPGLTAGVDNIFGTLDGVDVDVRTNNLTAMAISATDQSVAMTGDLAVAGNAQVDGNLDANGGADITGRLSLQGAASPLNAGGSDGVSGDVLISNGANTTPTWTSPNGLFWELDGNAGTTPGTNYVGTSDAQGVHFYVNGGVDNSLILNTNGSVQRDAGGDPRGSNAVDMQRERGAASQVASGDYATVGGGSRNTASGFSATVGGGTRNTASDFYATVGGGNQNTASDINATVGGGTRNTASAFYATVGGGSDNTASDFSATVGGGNKNRASSFAATVGGGSDNTASGTSATVGGGIFNTTSGTDATVGGGFVNTASGTSATVGGGSNNTVAGEFSTIPGGRGLTLDASADRSFGFLGGNTGANDMTISTPDVALFGNTDLWLANNDNGASQLRFYEANNTAGNFPGATNYTSFVAGVQAADINYTLPTAAPTVNGQVLSSTTGGTMSWITPSSDWSLTGNAGTTAGTNFLGTTDNVALHLRVNNADQMIFNTNGSIQRDAGGNGRGSNAVDMQRDRANPVQVASGISATIGGGSSNTASAGSATIGGGSSNTASAGSATIGGGFSNTASAGAATIGGGVFNTASGNQATVGGGFSNTTSRNYATVGGGLSNSASHVAATVGGGQGNNASGFYATVGGGQFNTASLDYATVGGGGSNSASAYSATVGGGGGNTASGEAATVGGGGSNTASDDYATVGGGSSNSASENVATVGGGGSNTASGAASTVGGGASNTASGTYATVGGGTSNNASDFNATIGGGGSNTASEFFATVGGGDNNTASAFYATVGGGSVNTASGFSATVGGGLNNTVAGRYSTIPGGRGLTLDLSADRSFGFLGGNTGGNNMTISTPDIAVFGNTDLWLANNDNAASQLRFYEAKSGSGAFPNGANYSSFRAGAQSGDINYILPTAMPTAGQILQASGVAGTTVTLTWAADATIAVRDNEDTPTSIAMPDDRDKQIDALLKLVEQQQTRIERLEATLLRNGDPQSDISEESIREGEGHSSVISD